MLNSTICTMKIFMLFALASVSVCNALRSTDIRCDEFKNDLANDDKCVIHALENGPGLMEAGQQILCKDKNYKEEKTDEYYKELEEEIETFWGCTGCDGLPRGLRHPLGEVGAGAANTTAEVLESIESLGHSVGLHEAVLDLACTLLNPAWSPDWGKKLIGEDVSKVTDNVKKMLCQKEKNPDVKMTLQILKDAGCFGNDVLGTGKVLANLTEDDGRALLPAVKNILGVMKDDPLIGKLVGGVLCTLDEVTNGLLGDGRR